MRIVFVINSIGSGGAERVLDTLIRSAPDGVELHLVVLDREPEQIAMSQRAQRHQLDTRKGMVASVRQLRQCLGQIEPDCVVSFLVRANMSAIIGGAGRPWRTIVCERMHLSSHLAGWYSGVGLWARLLMPRLLYPHADAVLAVSRGVERDLVDTFAVSQAIVRTINNPYAIEAIVAHALDPDPIPVEGRYFVASGRLVPAKGFDDLIDAYRKADPAEALVILGEGPERPALMTKIERYGLSKRVHLIGYLANPFPVIARASAFVSASHNEGFPNAIAEAMILGRPVLATNCPSGPAELLGTPADAVCGLVETGLGLVAQMGDVDALARGLALVAREPGASVRAEAARQRIAAFHVDRIAADYWAVFLGTDDLVKDALVL